MTVATATAAATVAFGLALSFGGGTDGGSDSRAEGAPAGDAVALLATKVPRGALGGSVTAVNLLVARCGDLADDLAGARALVAAAPTAGLGDDQQQWAAANAALIEGAANIDQGGPCRDELVGWLSDLPATDTIPVPAPPPTSISLEDQLEQRAAEDARISTSEDFQRLEPGQTLGEVRAILGSEGVVVQESAIGVHHDVVLRWPASGAPFATVRGQFRDGRLLAMTTDGNR